MSRSDESGEAREARPDRDSEGESPSLLQRLKRWAKDAVVAGTSTHGGVAGGIGGRRARKKR
jgi:hypothetical protein